MARNWIPCRRCGQTHTNPASSSLCSPCGEIYAKENAEREEMEAARQKAMESHRLTTGEALEELLYILMEDESILEHTKERLTDIYNRHDIYLER